MITRENLIESYIKFFKSKSHKEIPSASLVPENDSSVLFTTAGMQPLVPYLLGEKHPLGPRLVNVQKCLRTGDIESIGDSTHHTFFEMLGNWSLGNYWKKESIEYSFEFLTKVLKIPINKLAVSCFAGDKNTPKDQESAKIWQALGIPKERLVFIKEDNWWELPGTKGPCGPDTEIFFWSSKSKSPPKDFDPNNKNWIEIWNNVFMQYEKTKRTIIIDGMHCIYDENFNLNKELLEIINGFNSHCILAVNKFKEKGINLIKTNGVGLDTNWEIFSLEENNINKDNPEYFRRLLKKFKLAPEEIIYFDHNKKNVEVAQKIGILSKVYTNPKLIKEFIKDNISTYIPLKQKNVDTGMGVERTLAALNALEDNYQTSSFAQLIETIEKISNKKYQDYKKEMRIIADHIRAAVFLVADNVVPSNTEKGYVLRRLIRRALVYGKKLDIPKEKSLTKTLAETCIDFYKDYKLEKKRKLIENVLAEEENKFEKTLSLGMKEFEKLSKNKKITTKEAFLLFQSYGFPIELTKELANEKNIKIDLEDFQKEYKKHQNLSRSSSLGMFKSGLANQSEQTTRLHTATHLLNEALRRVLGHEVKQRGSNITPERLRFDFNFPRKLTNDELEKIESLVNKKISENLKVVKEELSYKEAIKQGAQAEFGNKYPSQVSVYTIQDNSEKQKWFSKEICTGPHVSHTKEIGKFKITKEESSSSGVRRIKAVIE